MTVSNLAQKVPQLSLNLDPDLADDYSSLRAFIAHQVEQQKRPAKSIAGDMDMAPSTLSRKLTAGLKSDDKDTQRFNCDDLELYMQVTGDTSPIEYLAAKYLHSDMHRQARLTARAEKLAQELERTMRLLREAS